MVTAQAPSWLTGQEVKSREEAAAVVLLIEQESTLCQDQDDLV